MIIDTVLDDFKLRFAEIKDVSTILNFIQGYTIKPVISWDKGPIPLSHTSTAYKIKRTLMPKF
jgi:hypothetical protein